MDIEKIEDSINTLEERWGNLECRLIQHEEGSEQHTKIKKAMDECNAAIKEYEFALDEAKEKKIDSEKSYAMRHLGIDLDEIAARIIEDLQKAESELFGFLTDRTDEVFEEEPEIDNARSIILDLIEKIKKEQS